VNNLEKKWKPRTLEIGVILRSRAGQRKSAGAGLTHLSLEQWLRQQGMKDEA